MWAGGWVARWPGGRVARWPGSQAAESKDETNLAQQLQRRARATQIFMDWEKPKFCESAKVEQETLEEFRQAAGRARCHKSGARAVS